MRINLPRGYTFLIDELKEFELPKDFKEEITRMFDEYTLESSKESIYWDKLLFIDNCVRYLSGRVKKCNCDIVMEQVKDIFEYELVHNGEFITKDDVYNLEFMEACYEGGLQDASLSQEFGEMHMSREESIKQKLLVEIIKIVIMYEKE